MNPENRNPFHVHPDAVIASDSQGARVVGHVHGDEGMSEDEVRHRIADEFDVEPSTVEVRSTPRQQSKRQVWGFSNWAGTNWEPTGPQGNPNLN